MKIIGHRGAKGLAPENTIFSFQAALRHHVDEIEFDVHVSKDDIPVLSHDPYVHNAAGETMTVRDHTYDELMTFHPHLETLDGALSYIDTNVGIVIEVKPDQPIAPIVAVIQENFATGLYSPQDIRFSSFSYSILKELKIAMPDCQLIVNEKWSGVRVSWRARRLGTKRIAMKARWLWRGFIVPVTRRGWQLTAYTVNDPVLAKRWEKYGMYGIYTDYPDRFKK